jgi:ABC-2 type transport system permease protein
VSPVTTALGTRAVNARGLALDVRAAFARAYVRLVGSYREPSWLVSDALFPVLGMLAFVLLYRALGAPPSFEALAVIGGILSTYWINVLWGMGAQLYWEKQQGQLALYFAAPCSRMSILTGMALGGIAMTTVRAVIGVALGFGVLGVRVQAFDPLAIALIFVVTMAALYALGMLMASLFLLYGREAWHICNALMEPVFFMSGLYFPIRTLGAFGAVTAAIVPLGLGLDAMRQLLLGAAAFGLMSVRVEVLLLVGLAIFYWFLARLGLDYLERLSKREGRLTQRWQ